MTCVTFWPGCARAECAAGPEVHNLTEHLSEAQIERYVSRRAGVDELLEAAQHLDVCFDCRDRAAALVERGSYEIPHTRRRRQSGPHAHSSVRSTSKLLPVTAIALLFVLAVVLVWLLLR